MVPVRARSFGTEVPQDDAAVRDGFELSHYRRLNRLKCSRSVSKGRNRKWTTDLEKWQRPQAGVTMQVLPGRRRSLRAGSNAIQY